MKTDARVKYTKMVLKKALLELMQHKPVNNDFNAVLFLLVKINFLA